MAKKHWKNQLTGRPKDSQHVRSILRWCFQCRQKQIQITLNKNLAAHQEISKKQSEIHPAPPKNVEKPSKKLWKPSPETWLGVWAFKIHQRGDARAALAPFGPFSMQNPQTCLQVFQHGEVGARRFWDGLAKCPGVPQRFFDFIFLGAEKTVECEENQKWIDKVL